MHIYIPDEMRPIYKETKNKLDSLDYSQTFSKKVQELIIELHKQYVKKEK